MSKTPAEIFKNSVRENFKFLKSSESIQQAYLRAIPVDQSQFLIPLSKFHHIDTNTLKIISDWHGDTNWLEKWNSKSTDDVLFLITDVAGNIQGHIGLLLNPGLDNALIISDIKSIENLKSELLGSALLSLIEWAKKTINVNVINLHSEDNSSKNHHLYMACGFVMDSNTIGSMLVYQPHHQNIGQSLILTAGPSISAKESVYAFDAAQHGWNSNWSKYLTAFERRFAEYVGVKYALATSSCTGALQIALMSLGISQGDEVIVPDQTWVATANAVRYVGATPIFADIELDTWNIDIESIEKLVTKNTKAIIPVHMYGHPARMTRIMEFAKKHNLKVVEDAAPAIGAEWEGQRCGSFGDFAAFSFQGAKLMVTGEGGMLVTNDDALYAKALKIWDQGRNPSRAFWIDADGVKFKMSNVQAAIGLGQLERVDELIEMKRRLFSWYQEGLQNTPFISLNKEVEGAHSIYWMSSLRLDENAPINRDTLMTELKKANIDSRPVFPAISQYPIWDRRQEPQPTALRVGAQAMNLPSGVCLRKDEVMYVAATIHRILKS
ncbi:DegT/DnrJ/EryC1/StrS family aminotransferase [Polynucleobacter sp. 73C-SIWE]|nr:DegT/DnrJ/EryC1/StrS family aminotransferase [Polynucleobacter sp. 73C-SIWE]MBU3578671.1 DegT/DnrJ/EryC1/StrS family aminotransferase [Polynucleobacter sp. 73C-SIWE]